MNDFKNIYTHLEICKANLKKEYKQSPEERKKILKARAMALAESSGKSGEDEAYLEVVEFFIADEKYAIELNHIQEVYPIKYITPLPCTPPFVVGIINLRGQIFSIIDLKKFYNLPQKETSNCNLAIILHCNEMEFGILADALFGVTSIPIKTVQTSLSMLTDISVEHLKGITQERVIILDGERILSDEKLIVI